MGIYKADESDSTLLRGFVEVNRLLGAAENLISDLALDVEPPQLGSAIDDLSTDVGELRQRVEDAIFAAMSGPDREKVEGQFRRWAAT